MIVVLKISKTIEITRGKTKAEYHKNEMETDMR